MACRYSDFGERGTTDQLDPPSVERTIVSFASRPTSAPFDPTSTSQRLELSGAPFTPDQRMPRSTDRIAIPAPVASNAPFGSLKTLEKSVEGYVNTTAQFTPSSLDRVISCRPKTSNVPFGSTTRCWKKSEFSMLF